MHTHSPIQSVGELLTSRPRTIPEGAGVYAFWWIGCRDTLLAANRTVILRGPKGVLFPVEYRDWWPEELPYPCLYVGKSTTLRKRFGLHIKQKSVGRLHDPHPDHHKAVPKTTSCQLRWGIEHIFPNEPNPLKIITSSVGFSYRSDFLENAVAERFFEEDRMVGAWRPWFNIDSER